MPDDREIARRKIFGRALRRLRHELGGIGHSEMTRRLREVNYPRKMGYQTIGNWERGVSKPVNIKEFTEYLVMAYNVTNEQRRWLAQAYVFPEDYELEEPAECRYMFSNT